MQRSSYLYVILATVLFICFLSILENKKANASLGFSYPEGSLLMNQWVVAEAVEQETQKDVTEQYSSEVWQFLNSNGFVQFRDRIISATGAWSYQNGIIAIDKDGEKDKVIFKLEKAGKNEIILTGKKLKLRLLKLEHL